LKKILLFSSLILLTNLSTAMASDDYENYNRYVESFNAGLDKAVIKPTTEGYIALTAEPVRSAVSNFVSNLETPVTIVNDLLQGKIEQSIQDSARFIFNSTFGIVGLIDISTLMGLEAHNEDFGQTFAHWGWLDSNYIHLPLLGPSTARDTLSKPLDLMMTNYGIPFTIARILTVREKIMPIDHMIDASADRYIFIRDAYLQQRDYLIHDGQSRATTQQFKSFDFSD
jgi:phospholipid-binding lipoprotein MlaA